MQDYLQITNHALLFGNSTISDEDTRSSRIASTEALSKVCPHMLFQAQVLEMPMTTAVRDQDAELDYMQLNNRANQLARHLRDLGLKPGDPVGVLPDFSSDMGLILLGVLKAGGYMVARSPNAPFRWDLSQDAVIVLGGACQAQGEEIRKRAICLDRDWHDIAEQPGANLAVPVEPYHPACRGASGNLISHGLLAHRAMERIGSLGLTRRALVSVDAQMGLDELLGHCLTAWLCGATVAMVS